VARHGTRLTFAKPKDGAGLDREVETVADSEINLDGLAVLRKWPSLNSEGSAMPCLVAEGNLEECIRQFTLKPMSELQFYEILTAPQGEEVTAVLSARQILELIPLRNFL
jgi:hypothetical protein